MHIDTGFTFIHGMIKEIFAVSVHIHFSVLVLHKCVNLPIEEQCSHDIQLFSHGMQKELKLKLSLHINPFNVIPSKVCIVMASY